MVYVIRSIGTQRDMLFTEVRLLLRVRAPSGDDGREQLAMVGKERHVKGRQADQSRQAQTRGVGLGGQKSVVTSIHTCRASSS